MFQCFLQPRLVGELCEHQAWPSRPAPFPVRMQQTRDCPGCRGSRGRRGARGPEARGGGAGAPVAWGCLTAPRGRWAARPFSLTGSALPADARAELRALPPRATLETGVAGGKAKLAPQMLRGRWRHQGHVCRGAKLLALTWGPTLEPPGPCGEELPSKPSTSGVGGHRGEGQSPEPVPSVPSSHPDCPSGSFRKLCWTILSFGAQWAHAQTWLCVLPGTGLWTSPSPGGRSRGTSWEAAPSSRRLRLPTPIAAVPPPRSPPSPVSHPHDDAHPACRLLRTSQCTPQPACTPNNASAPRLPPARQPVIGSLSPWGRDGRVSITSGPQRAAWRRPTRSGSGSGQHHHTQRTGEAPGRPGTP